MPVTVTKGNKKEGHSKPIIGTFIASSGYGKKHKLGRIRAKKGAKKHKFGRIPAKRNVKLREHSTPEGKP